MNPTAPPKEVAFQDDNSISLAYFGLTDDEKQMIWYTLREIDEFKAEAARDACVRLFHPQEMTSSPSSDEQTDQLEVSAAVKHTNKFVMVGNFDDKIIIEEDKTVATDAATCSTPRKCTNEFTHATDNEGADFYMRGLGFHFSRYRKRMKVGSRTSVLKWAKSINAVVLEKDPRRDELPAYLVKQLDKERQEKASLMLAKLSEKHSKEERHTALWRGRMDHQMAYPENYIEAFGRGIVSSASSENTSESETKKRMPVEGDQQQSKRRSIG